MTKFFIIYIVIINIVTFTTMYIDKRRAYWGKWRIKELTLFVLVMLGGGIGGILGMYCFRHKTKKIYFKIGFPLILILEIAVVLSFIF